MAVGASSNYRAIPPTDVHDARDSNPTRLWMSSEDLIKWTFFLLGCAILLPWLVMTNQTSFFLSRLANSPWYTTFSSSVSSVYSIVKLFCMFYCTTTFKRSSPSRRIFVSLTTTIFFIASLFSSTFFRGTPLSFFSFALFDAAFLAVLSSYLCSAVFAQAALLGPSFLQSVFTGQGGIAVMISIVQVVGAVISLWSLSPQSTLSANAKTDGRDNQAEDMAARIFFAFSALFVCATLASYVWMTKQTLYRSATSAVKRQVEVDEPDELTGLVSNDPETREEASQVYHVFKKNWALLFSIAYVYTITLAVFPAITVRVGSVDSSVHPLLFTAVHFLMFSVGDQIGRNSQLFPCFIVWTTERIMTLSVSRMIFIPLILLCNVDRPGTVPPIINSDVLFMVILFVMGYTNGYVMCLGLVVVSSLEYNPKLEGRREDVDTAATLAGLFMIVGLASGALSSFGVQALI